MIDPFISSNKRQFTTSVCSSVCWAASRVLQIHALSSTGNTVTAEMAGSGVGAEGLTEGRINTERSKTTALQIQKLNRIIPLRH